MSHLKALQNKEIQRLLVTRHSIPPYSSRCAAVDRVECDRGEVLTAGQIATGGRTRSCIALRHEMFADCQIGSAGNTASLRDDMSSMSRPTDESCFVEKW